MRVTIQTAIIVFFLQEICATLVADKFRQHGILPDVVRKAPQQALEVRYGTQRLDFGNQLTPTQVKSPPTLIRWQAIPSSFYTLIFADPDVPSRQNPLFRECEHWLVVNIPGNQVARGETLAEYMSSGPDLGTGLHRYTYLVYRQPNGKIRDPEHGYRTNRTTTGRPNWKAEQFAAKHHLEGPIAGNFFQAEYDDYVPIVKAQLSG